MSINFASAQVLRKGVTDTEADPVIPEPIEGKVHGEDYHHHHEPVKMSDGVKPTEYDASAFKPDPLTKINLMTLKSSSKYTVVNTKLKTEPRITHEGMYQDR